VEEAPFTVVMAGLAPAIQAAEGGFATMDPRVKPEGDDQRKMIAV
jgi:hypothetical protein